MTCTHILGFSRIGAHRELKYALEGYWKRKITAEELIETGRQLRRTHWQYQAPLSFITLGDFSFYDQVLDMSLRLGVVPERFQDESATRLDTYFRMARGRSPKDGDQAQFRACEMTKWFDTNYHFIVPELSPSTQFQLDASDLLEQVQEAKAFQKPLKVALLGPLTYLWLAKGINEDQKLDLLQPLLETYVRLLQQLKAEGVEWVQLDEPLLVLQLSPEWQHAFRLAYHELRTLDIKILLATYFGRLAENLQLACELPVAGLHLDGCSASSEIIQLADWLPTPKVLSLGIINGRNIWRAPLHNILNELEPLAPKLDDRLWLSTSCSLLHVPVDLSLETALDAEIKSWLAFGTQKIKELERLQKGLTQGRNSIQAELDACTQAIASRASSTRIHKPRVQAALDSISSATGTRQSPFNQRKNLQQAELDLPLLPTTTIGSFPQTSELRKVRSDFKRGTISATEYETFIKQEIAYCIQAQEHLGLDVLVHGEAERNDMVEYFGEHLEGFAFTQQGWVQSYGSRCVKPPIIFADVERLAPITLRWINYAQSLTEKPLKGMLTGPVTILNWSFVRDDQPRSLTCRQIALAIREEVLDLEQAGVRIIQIDEAALREGLPLRREDWPIYLDWAVGAFRIAANGVKDNTQIHTHMCYSEFNDILPAIAQMDADVITIETSRSDGELLQAFQSFAYPQSIGPGVYDIHSPNTPDQVSIQNLIKAAAEYVPVERL